MNLCREEYDLAYKKGYCSGYGDGLRDALRNLKNGQVPLTNVNTFSGEETESVVSEEEAYGAMMYRGLREQEQSQK